MTRRQFIGRGLARAITRPMYLLPPTDLMAEQRLVGACLTNSSLSRWVLSVMRPDQFADNVHEAIMEAMRDGKPLLELNLAEVGGASSYISQLRYYAEFPSDIVRDMASIVSAHGMRL
jgi:DnaB-like helicase N terminal domain